MEWDYIYGEREYVGTWKKKHYFRYENKVNKKININKI